MNSWGFIPISTVITALLSLSYYSASQADEWRVLASPYVWAPSMKGDVTVGGLKGEVDKSFSEIFGHLDSVFMGNVEITDLTLGFYLDGVHAQTSESHMINDQKVDAATTQTSLALGAFYRVYEKSLGGLTVFGEPRVFAVEPSLGIRWTKLKAKVEIDQSATQQKKTVDWVDPLVGLRLSADLTEQWTLLGQAEVGGMDTASKKTFSAQAYLGYRTYLSRYPTVVRVGYRLLSQEYETGDFTGNKFRYDVTQRGPVIGLTMRF